MFRKLLVANRGEIACRVIRACRDLGIKSVAVYSEADAHAPFTILADEAVPIGGASPAESYLNVDAIMAAVRSTGAEAVHPGYGFLSENRDFATACRKEGVVFVGPPSEAVAAMGEKVPARARMQKAGVPIVPGSGALSGLDEAVEAAAAAGYPVLVKASAGGGGIGMRTAADEASLREVWDSAKSTALRAFGNDTLFIEHYAEDPRHIEIQVIGDSQGRLVYVGERECSIQRRHQKILEETPSVALDDRLRQKMGKAAVSAAAAVGYVNAGTVEFIFSRGNFYFLEMNTRLQVEHPVTEEVYGLDLVVEQIRVAAGEPLSFSQKDLVRRGHAIECRINAEDPFHNFRPAPGRITAYREPDGPGVRVDSAITHPATVSPYYDPMIAKLIVWGQDRSQAIARMRRALSEYVIAGVVTNIPYHLAVLESEPFVSGNYSTSLIEDNPQLLDRAREIQGELARFAGLARDNAQVAAIAAAAATV